jgi:sugar lactone lactonase YvrE
VTPRRSRYEAYHDVVVEVSTGWRIETLVPGNRLFGSNGMAVAPDGRLWITELAGNQISRWDPGSDTMDLVQRMDGPIDSPDDIAFDRTGNAFVTTMHAGVVWKIPLRSEPYPLVANLPDNNGITVDRNERLFVDQMRDGAVLLEVDRIHPERMRTVATGLAYPNALAEGPDGRLYLQEMRTGRILAVDADDGRLEVVADGFEVPTSVRFDRGGRLVVTEAALGRVTALDLSTGRRTMIAHARRGLDNCCFDSAGNLYVSNFANCEVLRFAEGQPHDPYVIAPGGLVNPCGLALWGGDDGCVLVADDMGTVRADPRGTMEQATILQDHPVIPDHPADPPFNRYLVGVGSVATGRFIGVTASGGLYDMDLVGHRVSPLPYRPGGVTAVGNGVRGALIAPAKGGDLLELGPAGAVLGSHRRALTRVTALAGADDAVVACDANGGLVSLDRGGDVVTSTGFERPVAVAVRGDHAFVACEGGGRITRVALDGSRRDDIASGLPFGLPCPSPRSGTRHRPALLVEPDGRLLVSCDGDGSLRVLTGG